MSTSLKDRVRQAVEEGQKARSAYYLAIDLDDEQAFGPQATDDEILALEEKLQKKLPPSYRQFLKDYGSWRMASGAVDLLSVPELLAGEKADDIRDWQASAEVDGDDLAAKSLVVGYGEVTAIRLLLDPETINDDGEWALVGYEHGPDWTYPSFLEWLEASVNDFQLLVKEASSADEELEDLR